jgi:CRP/FNR family cyclic AMP-dependent transcriptional regulator
MNGIHFLRNVSLFADLSTDDLEALAQRLVARKYRSGEHIFEQGSPGNSLYIVKSGLVSILVADKTGESHMIAQSGPGQVFGEFGLLDGLPRSAGAVACERSDLLMLARPEFFMVLEQHPSVAINLVVLLSRRLRFAVQRAGHDQEITSPLARLAHVLADFGDRYGDQDDVKVTLSLRLTMGELAGMIGCPRSDAEEALEILQQRGLVARRGLQMTIQNLDELRAVATE